MVDWDSEQTIQDLLTIAKALQTFFLGLYVWELVQTSWFEWWLVRRKIAFRWPYIPYFVGRYVNLALLVAGLIGAPPPGGHPSCLLYGLVFPFMGAIILACSSLTLAIRAIVIAKRSPSCALRHADKLLIAATLVQWGIMAFSLTRVYQGGFCRLGAHNVHELSLQYLYTVFYDFMALVVSLVGLRRIQNSHSSLPKVLSRQGLGYFVVASVANALPAVCILTRVGATMALVVVGPALTSSTICSCRMVLQLIRWHSENESSSPHGNPLAAGTCITDALPAPILTTQIGYVPPVVLVGCDAYISTDCAAKVDTFDALPPPKAAAIANVSCLDSTTARSSHSVIDEIQV